MINSLLLMKDKIYVVGFLITLFTTLLVLTHKNTESGSFWKELIESLWRYKFGNTKRNK